MRISDQEFNRLAVLKLLRQHEPVARTDLAGLSGLTGGTITAIVRDLVERGMILEEKVTTGERGRPRVNLRINPDGGYVIGATLLAQGDIQVALVNLKGEPISTLVVPFQSTTRYEALVEQFVAAIRRVLDDAPVAIDRIGQIGVGLPAFVDHNAGVVDFLIGYEGGPYPVASAIARALGLPVSVDNNINLLARATHWFGDLRDVDDFTLVVYGLGIGAARYQDGQIALGRHGVGVEIGHTKVVADDGLACHCGARGCVQAYAAMGGLVEQFAEARGRPQPHYYDIANLLREMLDEADEPDVAAMLHRAGHYLGVAIANHLNTQDPARVIMLATEWALVEHVRAPFEAAVRANTVSILRDVAPVTFYPHDDQWYAKGAVAMVLEQLYRSDRNA